MEECLKEPSFIGLQEVVFTLFPDENDARRTNYTKSDDVVTDTQQLRNAQESIFGIQNIQFGFAGDIDKEGATQWTKRLKSIFSSSTESGTAVEPIYFGTTFEIARKSS